MSSHGHRCPAPRGTGRPALTTRVVVCLLMCLLVCFVAIPALAQYPLRLPPRPNVPPAPLPPLPPRPVSAAVDSTSTIDARSDAPGNPLLIELLKKTDPNLLLRVTLLTRDTLEGHPRAITDGTLWLATAKDSKDVSAGPGVPVAVDDIARVQQWRSAAEKGGEAGGRMGMVVGGLIGLLAGAGLAGWDGDSSNDLPTIVAGGMGGAALAGLSGGLLGAGLGATGRTWYTIWPDETSPDVLAREAAVAAAAARPPTLTRLLFEAGYSGAGGDVYDAEGLELAAGLLGRPDRALELGPVIRYHALGGRVDVPPSGGGGRYTDLQPIATISLDARWTPDAAGWRPWLDGGLGFSLANDLFASGHLGLGLRLRDRRGRDYGLALRRHAALVDITDGLGGWWTAGAVFSFSP